MLMLGVYRYVLREPGCLLLFGRSINVILVNTLYRLTTTVHLQRLFLYLDFQMTITLIQNRPVKGWPQILDTRPLEFNSRTEVPPKCFTAYSTLISHLFRCLVGVR